MPLMKGAQDPAQQEDGQLDLSGYSDSDQRKIKTGLILGQMRRYWRIICLVGFVITFFYALITDFAHFGFWPVIQLVIVTVFFYLFVLYLFLYIAAGWTIRIFLYFKDLFGGSKNTRL